MFYTRPPPPLILPQNTSSFNPLLRRNLYFLLTLKIFIFSYLSRTTFLPLLHCPKMQVQNEKGNFYFVFLLINHDSVIIRIANTATSPRERCPKLSVKNIVDRERRYKSSGEVEISSPCLVSSSRVSARMAAVLSAEFCAKAILFRESV